MQVNKSSKKTLFFALSILILGCIGCAPRYSGPEFLTAPRQAAPQPVYNRVTTALPPEVLPQRKLKFKGAPKVSQLIHLEAKDETLETITKRLASLAHYRSYTAAAVADRVLSFDALGTLDELASRLEVEGGVYISVDHGNHEIRVLPPKKTRAKLYR